MANSLPLRLNNPFALRKTCCRWLGKVESNCAFEQFDTLEHGLRAGLINLLTQMRKHKSLKDLIYSYAPPCENDSLDYYLFVRSRVVGNYQYILQNQIAFAGLAHSIARFECGPSCPITLLEITDILTKYHIFAKHKILLSRTQK